METRAYFLPRTRPKSPPVLRDRRSPRRHPRVGDTAVIIGRVRTRGREPSSSGHFINLDFTEGERCLSAGRRVPKTTVVRTLAIGRTPTGSSMRQDVKQISVGISGRRPGMPAYGTTSASHLSLALRVFSLEEAIVVCSFIPPNPPTLLPRYVLPAPCTMHPLRSTPFPCYRLSFAWITSGSHSNPHVHSCVHSHRCPLSGCTAPKVPVWRAGRAEFENPRTHHHGAGVQARLPYMGRILIRQFAPSMNNGKHSGWEHSSRPRS